MFSHETWYTFRMANKTNREEFLSTAIPVDAHATYNRGDWELAANRLAGAAVLGRSAKWKSACNFAMDHIEDGADPQWAVIQGIITMGWYL